MALGRGPAPAAVSTPVGKQLTHGQCPIYSTNANGRQPVNGRRGNGAAFDPAQANYSGGYGRVHNTYRLHGMAVPQLR
jgi:hypothetical protein